MPKSEEALRVFISHAGEDRERFVRTFAERLVASGVNAWVSFWEMLPGDSLVDKIFNEGLKPSDAVVVVMSEFSINKPWVQKELNVAVVKSIEDRTKLIPVCLEGCKVPECLRDTLWQNISNLDSYDSQFEYILNSIHGQYKKPPLGERPVYIRPDVLHIGNLAQIDAVFFEAACRIAIDQGHPLIHAEPLVASLKEQGISEEQIMETQEVLEGRYYVKLFRVLGPPHAYDFSITTHGFEQFAREGVPNYDKFWTDVARILVRKVLQEKGQTSKHSIANELQQPRFIVEHLLEEFENKGLIKVAKSIGGDLFMDVWWVSPELRRRLAGDA
jgi:TIR domain